MTCSQKTHFLRLVSEINVHGDVAFVCEEINVRCTLHMHHKRATHHRLSASIAVAGFVRSANALLQYTAHCCVSIVGHRDTKATDQQNSLLVSYATGTV